MKFYNRKKELEFFSKLKKEKNKKFVVIYGRRRVGKTSLVKEAFKDEKDVFYHFVEVKKEESLLRELSLAFSKAIYANWYDLFTDLFSKYKYVIFDEFQNFTRVNKNIFYALQHAWDENKSNTKFIVLGSYVGLMKNLFMDEKMPLFGRADYVVKLKEFSLRETMRMLSDFGYNLLDAFQIYAMVGGIPRYLWLFENKKDLKSSIYEVFLNYFAPLKDEAKNILVLEFGSESRTYFSILEALAGGMKSSSEISDITGIEITTLPKYLEDLTKVYELTEKVLPLFSKKRKKSKFAIKDLFYNFYFYNVYRNYSLLEFAPEKALKMILKNFNNYMGIAFERICKAFIVENYELFNFFPKSIGKTWGKVPYRKNESFDIDIVAFDEKTVLFGECKWRNKEIDIGEYEKLKIRSEFVNVGNRRRKYVIFSKNGFKEDLVNLKSENLYLLSLKDIEKFF